MRTFWPGITLTLAATLIAAPSAAQQAPTTNAQPTLRVFLDCNAHECDFDHVRREITWVTWVRDRTDADLHLLITDQETGSGGQRYTLTYLGRGRLEGTEKSLTFVSQGTETDAEVREGMTRTAAVGLVQFIEQSPLASRLQINYQGAARSIAVREQRDPWDLWVFRLATEGSLEGEAQQRSYSLEATAEASRVSEALKFTLWLNGQRDHESFELDDGTTISNTSEDYTAHTVIVWSLGPHWSAGAEGRANRSTFLNRDLALSAGPAVEYNIFPYRESTRRSLTVRYAVEIASFNYQLPTIEGKTAQVLPRHVLSISTAVQQPWGEIFGSVEGTQYLNDPSLHRINTRLRLEYRLFRGFSLEASAEFSRIKDQFYLPALDLSEEEILLERRQRETDFQYDFGIGLSYQFGSSFANIVNPRF